MVPTLHAIIPAGGAGSRLWPLSRKARPKFLLDPLDHGKTLLQETFDRLKDVSLTITVVTGKDHYEEVCRQLPELTGESDEAFPGEILIEPSPRDSMAAIGLATYIIRERYGDLAVVGSFAADHVIVDVDAFHQAVRTAGIGASAGLLTTLGIVPTEPSTAFGYIEPGTPAIAPGLYPARRFVEKPDLATAATYNRDGYLWNAGMFIAQTGTICAALSQKLPAMDTQLSAIAKRYMTSLIRDGEAAPINPAHWDRLTKIAIDYALAEPMAEEGKVAVVPAQETMGWSDVGDFQAVHRLKDPSQANLVLSADRAKQVRVIGLEGVAVVDSDDALLIVPLARSQEVKQVVDQIAESGDVELL